MDSNYVAIRSIAQTAPTFTTATDNYALKDAATQGNLCGLILEVGSKKEYASFVAFQDAIIANSSLNKTNIATDNIVYTSAKGDVLNIQYNSSGTFTEPLYDWGYGPTTPQVAQKSPPFVQPTWPNGEGCGRIASWSVNSVPVDFTNAKWGVYDGPNFSLKNSVLRITDGNNQTMEIDYTGTLPVYNPASYTALDNISEKDGIFKLYPNPATNLVNIELYSNYRGSYFIELSDLTGKSMLMMSNEKTTQFESIQLPLSEKFRGLYLLKIKTGNNTFTKKVQII
jgi:hypothetical protein